MNVVIISGPEATGKSAIGRAIAEILGYHYIGKDVTKEALFDVESHSTWDAAWYETKAKHTLFDELEDYIAHNKSAVIESNFIDDDKQRLAQLINDKVTVTEVYCSAKGLTTFKRFVKRNERGQRHKGHHDRRWYLRVLIEDLLKYVGVNWPSRPTGLTSRLYTVDSTDFSTIDYDKIARFIRG